MEILCITFLSHYGKKYSDSGLFYTFLDSVDRVRKLWTFSAVSKFPEARITFGKRLKCMDQKCVEFY